MRTSTRAEQRTNCAFQASQKFRSGDLFDTLLRHAQIRNNAGYARNHATVQYVPQSGSPLVTTYQLRWKSMEISCWEPCALYHPSISPCNTARQHATYRRGLTTSSRNVSVDTPTTVSDDNNVTRRNMPDCISSMASWASGRVEMPHSNLNRFARWDSACRADSSAADVAAEDA